LEPANTDAQLQRAGLLIKRRQLDEAQLVAQKIIAVKPKNVQAHVILGQKYTLAHDFAKAILEFETVVKLDPRPENYGALGAVYRAAGRSPEAEDAYRKGIAAHPKSYQAHMALGQFYFSEKRLAEA